MFEIKKIMLKLKKFFVNYYPFILFLGLILFFSRKFILKEGYFLFSEFFESVNYAFTLKHLLKSWTDYTALGYSNITSNNWLGTYSATFIPYLIFLTFIEIVFGALKSKVVILLSIFLPFLSMYLFSYRWFKSFVNSTFYLKAIAFASALVYSINSEMGTRIFAGHQSIIFGYGIFPLLLLCLFEALETKDSRNKKIYILLSGLIYSILFWLTPHLIFLSVIPLGLYFIFFSLTSKKNVVSFFVTVLTSGLIGFIINFYAWAPPIFFNEKFFTISSPTYYAWHLFWASRFSSFNNVIRVFNQNDVQLLIPKFQKMIFNLKLIFPIIALAGFLLLKKSKKTLFIFFLTITGIILSMGVHAPFEKIYVFLYKYIFIFKSFRDPSKFLILYLFGLSLFTGYFFTYIYNKKKQLLYLFAFFFTVLIIVANPFFYSGNFNNNIVPLRLPQKYEELNNFLAKDKEDYRIEIFPNDVYLGQYQWNINVPISLASETPFGSLFPLKKNPVKLGSQIYYPSYHYLDFLESNIESDWAIKKFGDAGVKYVIVDHSIKDYEKNNNLLSKNNLLIKTNFIEGFTIFEIKDYQKQALIKKNAIYYYGNMSGLKYLPADLSIINLNLNNADILDHNYSSSIFIYKSSINDIFLDSLKDYRVSFLNKLRFNLDGTKDFLLTGWYANQFIKKGINPLNLEGMYTNGPNSIQQKLKIKKGNYKVFVSVLNHPDPTTGTSNSMKISFGNKSQSRININGDKSLYRWVDFGEFKVENDSPLIQIKNLENKYLYIDSVLVIPTKVFTDKQNNFNNKIKSKKIYYIDKVEDFGQIKNNSKEITIMNSSYSPYWNICNKPTFIVDFYAIGSDCEKIKPNPYFTPDKFYKFSLLLSGFMFISLIGYIIYLKRKTD